MTARQRAHRKLAVSLTYSNVKVSNALIHEWTNRKQTVGSTDCAVHQISEITGRELEISWATRYSQF